MRKKGCRDILLVGSFALPSAESVFRTVSDVLGDRVSRIPDGETGDRSQWIRWQVFAFRDNPAFELDPDLKGSDYQTDFYVLRPGLAGRDVTFGSLGLQRMPEPLTRYLLGSNAMALYPQAAASRCRCRHLTTCSIGTWRPGTG